MELTLVLSTDAEVYEAVLGQYIETNIAETREDRLAAEKAAATTANNAHAAAGSEAAAKVAEQASRVAAERADGSANAAVASEQQAAHSAQTAQTSSLDALSAAGKTAASAAAAEVSATNAAKSASAAAVSEHNAAATLTGALMAGHNLADVADKAAARANLDAPDRASVNDKVSRAGDTMTGTLYVPIARFNEGLLNDGSVPEIYNDSGKRNLVFRTGPESAYKYCVLDENGTLTLPARPQWGATPWDTGNFDPLSLVAKAGDTLTGTLYSNGNEYDAGTYRVSANIGGAFVDWADARKFAVQIDAPNYNSAYGVWRVSRWGGRHLAGLDVYEGGGVSSEPTVVLHIDAQNNAWTFSRTNIFRGAGGTVWGTWNFDPNTKLNKAGDTMEGDFVATGNIIAYSDESLKKDWTELPDDIIDDLATVLCGTFTRTDTGGRQVGVGARSLREVLPEAVFEGEKLAVAYGNAALAICVKLSQRVIALASRVAELESRK